MLLFYRKMANSGMHQEVVGRRKKNYKEGVHENIGNKSKKIYINIGGFVNI